MSAEPLEKARETVSPLDMTPPMGIDELLNNSKIVLEEDDDKTMLMTEDEIRPSLYRLDDLVNGTQYVIKGFPYTIGRSSLCDLNLSSKKISRNHAVLKKEPGGVSIENQSSLNGVFVNATKVNSILLQDNDEITIGDHKFIFHVENLEDRYSSGEQFTREDMTAVGMKKDKKAFFKKLVMLLSILIIVGCAGYFAYMRWVDSKIMYVESKPVAQQVNMAPAKPVSTSQPVARKTVQKTPPVRAAVAHETKPVAMVNAKPHKAMPIKKVILSQQIKDGKTEIQVVKKLYLSGKYQTAIENLDALLNTRKFTTQAHDRAERLKSQMRDLYGKYQSGTEQYARGSKAEAFKQWISFLKMEKASFPGEKSMYANEVEKKVADEYERMGNAAYLDERWHDAYHYWLNAIRINSKTKITPAYNSLVSNARDVYRDAYRLETVDINRAIRLWKKVLVLVPRENEYHVKAAAKLEWYSHLEGNRE